MVGRCNFYFLFTDKKDQGRGVNTGSVRLVETRYLFLRLTGILEHLKWESLKKGGETADSYCFTKV